MTSCWCYWLPSGVEEVSEGLRVVEMEQLGPIDCSTSLIANTVFEPSRILGLPPTIFLDILSSRWLLSLDGIKALGNIN